MRHANSSSAESQLMDRRQRNKEIIGSTALFVVENPALSFLEMEWVRKTNRRFSSYSTTRHQGLVRTPTIWPHFYIGGIKRRSNTSPELDWDIRLLRSHELTQHRTLDHHQLVTWMRWHVWCVRNVALVIPSACNCRNGTALDTAPWQSAMDEGHLLGRRGCRWEIA